MHPHKLEFLAYLKRFIIADNSNLIRIKIARNVCIFNRPKPCDFKTWESKRVPLRTKQQQTYNNIQSIFYEPSYSMFFSIAL